MASTEMVKYSPGAFNKLRKKYDGMTNRLQRANKKAETFLEGFIGSAEIQGSAFMFGALQGAVFTRSGKQGPEAFGVPAEVMFSGAMFLLNLMGVGGKYSNHLTNFGNGALAAYVSNFGRGYGAKWAKEGKIPDWIKGEGEGADQLKREIASLLE